jgi:hypothetical protein
MVGDNQWLFVFLSYIFGDHSRKGGRTNTVIPSELVKKVFRGKNRENPPENPSFNTEDTKNTENTKPIPEGMLSPVALK